mmetsp:Transcript_13676/g.32810  ORF Transcript_13676/g.32810 Transcript_13676/m.32810 type:complete len:209 (+) Transcript_13676:178-804(+)
MPCRDRCLRLPRRNPSWIVDPWRMETRFRQSFATSAPPGPSPATVRRGGRAAEEEEEEEQGSGTRAKARACSPAACSGMPLRLWKGVQARAGATTTRSCLRSPSPWGACRAARVPSSSSTSSCSSRVSFTWRRTRGALRIARTRWMTTRTRSRRTGGSGARRRAPGSSPSGTSTCAPRTASTRPRASPAYPRAPCSSCARRKCRRTRR